MFKQGDIVQYKDKIRYGIVEKITSTECVIRYTVDGNCGDSLFDHIYHFQWSYTFPHSENQLYKNWTKLEE